MDKMLAAIDLKISSEDR